MPVLRRRYDNVLMFRPNGTRYSEGKHDDMDVALGAAWDKFVAEFGEVPVQERTIIEVLGVTGAWDVTLFELPAEEA